MMDNESAKGEGPQTGPVLHEEEATKDIVKSNDSETKIPVKERIIDRIDYLTQNQADKFAVTDRSNDYMSIITANTIINYDSKTYTLGLAITNAEVGDEFSQTMLIGDDQKQSQSQYRLDIKRGKDVTKERQDLLEEIEKVKTSDSKAKNFVLRAIDSIYPKDLEGEIIFISSNFAETELSDQEALKILSSINLQFPPDMRNCPSLEEIFRQRHKKILGD